MPIIQNFFFPSIQAIKKKEKEESEKDNFFLFGVGFVLDFLPLDTNSRKDKGGKKKKSKLFSFRVVNLKKIIMNQYKLILTMVV